MLCGALEVLLKRLGDGYRSGRLALHALLYAFFWWILTEGDPGAWWVGIPCIAIAVAVSARSSCKRDMRLGLLELPRFGIYFIGQSVRGGIDVARRAFLPSLPISPALIDVPIRIPPGPARLFLANVTNLLPGTMTVAVQADRLQVHVIDSRVDLASEIGDLEERVMALYGIADMPRQRHA